MRVEKTCTINLKFFFGKKLMKTITSTTIIRKGKTYLLK